MGLTPPTLQTRHTLDIHISSCCGCVVCSNQLGIMLSRQSGARPREERLVSCTILQMRKLRLGGQWLAASHRLRWESTWLV